ncbi:hypothetical protein BB561_005756 [Smittium simulii]|uniref:Pacifastin domain-containing protein n=1 Tax=Smittium simulii TaxID=133385 RepID=A0A2T9Y8G9_9FUNG|nr:hypothetical protein BB561_005756 [Smittium simulii]
MFKNILLISSIAISALAATQQTGTCVSQYGSDSFKSPYDSCNTCKCDSSGQLDCTKNSCPPIESTKEEKYQECVSKYGTGSFLSPKDGCNLCSCRTNGIMACSKMICPK